MNTELNGVFISHQVYFMTIIKTFFNLISIKQYNFLYIVDLKSVIDLENVFKNRPFLPL